MIAPGIQNLTATRDDRRRSAIPFLDQHAVRIIAQKGLPQYASIVVETEMSPIDFVTPIAVQITHRRNVRRVPGIAIPPVLVVPEHFEPMVERQDVIAQLDDEIPWLRTPGKIGDHQALVHVVGNLQLPIRIGIAAQKLRGSRALFERPGSAIEYRQTRALQIPFTGAFQIRIGQQANNLLMPVLVYIADRYRPGAIRGYGLQHATTIGILGAVIPIPNGPEQLPRERKRPQKTGFNAPKGLVDQKIDLTVPAEIADPNIAPGPPTVFVEADTFFGQGRLFIEHRRLWSRRIVHQILAFLSHAITSENGQDRVGPLPLFLPSGRIRNNPTALLLNKADPQGSGNASTNLGESPGAQWYGCGSDGDGLHVRAWALNGQGLDGYRTGTASYGYPNLPAERRSDNG